MSSRAVGLDIGGSAIKAGRIAADGTIEEQTSRELGAATTADSFREALLVLARELGAGPDTPVGIGSPGLLDREAGLVTKSPNLPWQEGLPVVDLVAEELGLDRAAVAFENDANVAALGEQWLGGAAGVDDVLLATLGTGIGGGLILGGELWVGRGMAGEVGHVTVDPDGPACGCGSRGCLETLASATAARRRALEAGLEGDPSSCSRSARAPPRGPSARSSRPSDGTSGAAWPRSSCCSTCARSSSAGASPPHSTCSSPGSATGSRNGPTASA